MMSQVYFRFYAQLNFFLPQQRRQITFTHQVEEHSSIKDAIEALGVPHTEIQLILVNSEPVTFTYRVQPEDRISVYPPFRSIDILPLMDHLLGVSSAEIRFVLDVHLGRLAAYLRMLGFDTLYRNDYADEQLAQISSAEDRIVLTRDLGVLKRKLVKQGYYVRETNPERQLAEVLRHFNLIGVKQPFRRCLQCNNLLERVDKESIGDRLPPNTKEYYDEFHICRVCDKIFWKGSHYQRMQRLIDNVLQGNAT
jgi:uncharacterized protein with PIN domain